MRKRPNKINTKKLHCKHCGGVTHLSNKVEGYLDLKPEQISPWRCEHCGAVYEFVDPDDLSQGYKLANDPDKDRREQAERDAEALERAKQNSPHRTRRDWRFLKRKKGKSKLTRKKKGRK